MHIQAGQVLELTDLQQRPIGQVTIERSEGELLLGDFAPGPAFSAVAQLFRDFEEAVNHQALGVVDRLDAAITALGLHLRKPDGTHHLDVKDVQIWSDGGISCRINSHDLPPTDSRTESVQAPKPAQV
jgi:hypothetical protein